MTIAIEVIAKEEDGTIIFQGKLNKQESSFLLGYAINDLLAAGVQFHLEQPDEGESRLKFPASAMN